MFRSALLIIGLLFFLGCESAGRKVTIPTPSVRYSDAPSNSRGEYGPAAAEKRVEAKRHATKAIPAARLNIGTGSAANDGTGDPLRTAFGKANTNFIELYANLTIVSNLATSGSAANKLNTNAGTAWALKIGDATVSRAAVIGADGIITNSAGVSTTELEYLDGVTSALQAQLNAKRNTNEARVANVLTYGAVAGSGDDYSAFTNALAQAGDIIVPQGTFDIGSNLVISQTNRIIFETGGRVRPASGVTISVRGYWDAALVQCIDITLGGKVVFDALAAGVPITRTPIIWLDWWGASPNNPDGADTSRMQAWMYSTPASLATVRGIQQGIYRLGAPLSVSNKWVVRGYGKPQINFAPTASSVGALEIAPGSSDVIIEGLKLGSVRTSATNTFTNLYGIKVGTDSDRLDISGNQISAFNGGGIHLDGGSFSEGNLYAEIRDNFFQSIDNSAANGGNGLAPAHAIMATNLISDLTISGNNILDCDAAYWIHGNSETNQAGSIKVVGDTVESAGQNGVTTTNIGTFIVRGSVTIDRIYLEANLADFGIYVRGAKTLRVDGETLAADYSGITYTGTMIAAHEVGHTEINSANFNNCKTNFIAQLGNGIVVARDCWFDLGSATGTNQASQAQIAARLVGNVLIKGRTQPTANQIPSISSDGKFEEWKSVTGSGSVVLATSPTITTPTIADFTNANHDHLDADDGGLLDAAAINSGTFALARISALIDTSAELISIVGDETGTGALVFGTSPTLTTPNIGAATATSPAANDDDTSVATTEYVQDELTAYDSDTRTLSNKTLASPTVTGSVTFPDNTRQTFNPGADAAGINVGSHAGDPGTPSNGDLWYDSSANELTARINGANVALGAGGGGVSDGDKGDITVSGSGATFTIDNDVVSNAKAANMAEATIKARVSSGTGDPEDATFSQIDPLTSLGDWLIHDGSNSVRGYAAKYWRFTDEFLFGSTSGIAAPWDSGGTGSHSQGSGESGHPGIYNQTASTSTTGAQRAHLGVSSIRLGGGAFWFECVVLIPDLSDATDEYDFRIGLGDTLGARHSDGVYFEYDRNNNANWVGACNKGGAGNISTVDTGSAVGEDTWVRLGFIVNADATSVQFYVNGAAAGAAVTANIPNTDSNLCGAYISIAGSAGTSAANRTARIDYVDFGQILTTPR